MEKIQRDEFYRYKFLSNLKVSPAKTQAAVTVSQCNPEDNSYISNIWVRTAEGFSQLTGLDKAVSYTHLLQCHP